MRIIGKDEPITVGRIRLALYGEPGLGKTTIASTARNALMIDTDESARRAKLDDGNRRRCDVAEVTRWRDIENIRTSDLAPYDTIFVDTLGRCLDMISIDMKGGKPLHLQDWGILKSRFASWCNTLASAGKDLIYVAHSREKRIGESIKEEMDIQGSSKIEMQRICDLIGRMFASPDGTMLTFNPSESGIAKNPAGIKDCVVPHVDDDPTFMADIIDKAKVAMTEEFGDSESVKTFAANLKDVTLDGFNELVTRLKASDDHTPREKIRMAELLRDYANDNTWTRNEDGIYIAAGS